MNNIKFPLELTFKVTTIANDFVAKDADGLTIAYVRQKMFKLVEEIEVFSDETKENKLYTIKANQWLDFSASYSFTNNVGYELGKVARKGWASMWKAHYDVFSKSNKPEFTIREENAWIKVGDAFLTQIPILGIFTGYFLNPSYIVTDENGIVIARLKKEQSFFGRKFTVSKLGNINNEATERIILSLIMMILLERKRG